MSEWTCRSRRRRSSVVDGRGEIVSEGTVISEPAAIAELIEAKAGGARRIGFKKAKLAVARKLAVILHRMWRDGTDVSRSSKEAAA